MLKHIFEQALIDYKSEKLMLYETRVNLSLIQSFFIMRATFLDVEFKWFDFSNSKFV